MLFNASQLSIPELPPHTSSDVQATPGPVVLFDHADSSHPDPDTVYTALSRADGYTMLRGL